MSAVIVNGISYRHPDKTPLFDKVHLSVDDDAKVAVVGDNGTGKSTLLRIVAGKLQPSEGSVHTSSAPYYVPQNIGASNLTVGEALGIAGQITAIEEITKGNADPAYFETLNDDWDVETRARQALESWGLCDIGFSDPADRLSGGELTKLYLAGIEICNTPPKIVLLDEPTNHLDDTGRKLLYELIRRSKAAFIIVSHDITLLNLLDRTCELTAGGLKIYGGNYDFYRKQKEIEAYAISESIHAEEKALRLARRKAHEINEKQQNRERSGHRNLAKGGQPRIIAKAKAGKGEETGAKLRDIHQHRIAQVQERLDNLYASRADNAALKFDFADTGLHRGKLLFSAEGINHEYHRKRKLWSDPLDFSLYSGDRIHLTGKNGSGKTTLVKILTGKLIPSQGVVRRASFSHVYLDQNCGVMDNDITVIQMANSFNAHNLKEHEIRMRLNRAMFSKETLDKSCRSLSGGERIRLYLCCLMISNHVPDLFIMDEPSNNLDISTMRILTDTARNYQGSLLVISHDRNFVEKIGVTAVFPLTP